MKYQYHNQPIPQEARKELNEKILYLVDQDLAAQSGISCEDIFNAYTGDGGLHGLNRSDFDNYHEFSEAKKEIENGQFFTPPALCRFVMEALQPGMDETVADLTSGIANFCNFMPIEANFYGCELDIKSHKVAHYLYPAANLEHRDIRYYNPNMRFDYVVGNPPFNLKWDTDQGEYLSQMYYCVKAAQLLKPLGIMAIVVPSSFLADEFLDHAKISELEKDFSFLGQVSIPAGAFKYLGVSNFPTSLMFWQKKLNPEDQGNRYNLTEANCFSMVALENTGSLLNTVRQNVVAPAKERMQRDRSRAKLALHSGNDSDFHYQVQKMLYQIKSNPKIRDKYAKCQEYLYRFEHQVMPENMKYKEWAKIRITEAKALAYLRRTVRSQHTKPTRVKFLRILVNLLASFVVNSGSTISRLCPLKRCLPTLKLHSFWMRSWCTILRTRKKFILTTGKNPTSILFFRSSIISSNGNKAAAKLWPALPLVCTVCGTSTPETLGWCLLLFLSITTGMKCLVTTPCPTGWLRG